MIEKANKCIWTQAEDIGKFLPSCVDLKHKDMVVVMHYWALKDFKVCPYCAKQIEIEGDGKVIKFVNRETE